MKTSSWKLICLALLAPLAGMAQDPCPEGMPAEICKTITDAQNKTEAPAAPEEEAGPEASVADGDPAPEAPAVPGPPPVPQGAAPAARAPAAEAEKVAETENGPSSKCGNQGPDSNLEGTLESACMLKHLDLAADVPAPRGEAQYPGSTLFTTCQKMIPSTVVWAQAHSQDFDTLFKQSWINMRDLPAYSSLNELRELRADKFEEKFVGYISAMERHAQTMKECYATIQLTTLGERVDYTDPEYTTRAQHKAVDGQIGCRTEGAETQDYGACKTLANSYSAALLGEKGVHTFQEVDFMSTQMDSQLNVMKNPNDPTGALRAQRDSVKKQEEIANVRMAVDVAKIGTLQAAVSGMPKASELVEECSAKYKSADVDGRLADHKEALGRWMKEVLEQAKKKYGKPAYAFKLLESKISTFTSKVPPSHARDVGSQGAAQQGGMSKDMVNACDVGYGGKLQLIVNTPARDQANKLAMESGVDAAANIAKAVILNKQADKIDSAINGIKTFKPEDGLYGERELLATECQITPSLQKCIDAGFSREQDFYGNGIVINGNGNATSGGNLDGGGSDIGSTSQALGKSDRSDSVTGGFANIASVDKGNGFSDGPAGRAGVKVDKSANPGGGGGGGGGAGAPNGGGGEASSEGGTTEGVGSGSGAQYTGTATAYGGGAGAGRKAPDKSANPFANLLGKKATKDMNFRNPASDEIGGKGKNIFDIISTRYGVVAKDKRLLEYEEQK